MKFLLLSSLFFVFSCSQSAKNSASDKIEIFALNSEILVGKTAADQDVKLGGFSSLVFDKYSQGKLFFWTITDRGPNAEEDKGSRPFLVPDFSPLLVRLSIDTKSKTLQVESYHNFKKDQITSIHGLPPANPDKKTKTYETPVDIFGKTIATDNYGMDSEGLCRLENDFFVSDEYGPDLFKFNKDLILQQRWSPGKGLPESLKSRRINRGLEALACADNFVYLLLQSPLKKSDDRIPFMKFSPKDSKVVQTFYYPVDRKVADKIGDMVHLKNDEFLVLEQNGETGAEKGVRRIYKVVLGQAATDGLLKKELIVDLVSLGFNDAEKVEGIAIVSANQIAVITDNDFGIDGTLDFKTGKAGFKPSAPSLLALITLQHPL